LSALETVNTQYVILKGKTMTEACVVAQEFVPCITFLNMTGDITLTWDEQNREKIIEMVRKKMKEGYTFFTTKKVPLIRLYREVKVTEKNIDGIESLIISDEDFDKFTKAMDDADVAAAVRDGHAHMSKRKQKSDSFETVKRLKNAEEVVDRQALAVRPLAGG
jgi:hypothetical protein